MSATPPRWTDERLAIWVGGVLRIGVACAAGVVALGAILYLYRHGWEPASYGVFRGEPAQLTSVPGIVRAALAPGGRGLIQLGLLLLIATPVARVAFSLVGFALEKDRMYVMVSSIVLATLAYSLLGA